MRSRQRRFIAGTLGGWIAARVAMLWPAAIPLVGGVGTAVLLGTWLAAPHPSMPAPFSPWPRGALRQGQPASVGPTPASIPAEADRPLPAGRWIEADGRRLVWLAAADGTATGAGGLLRHAVYVREADAAPSPPPARMARRTSRLSADAYLFVRLGSGGGSLAPVGQLGGSQAALRLAWALNRDGPVRAAIAARIYAPLATHGAEAAIGIDWHPLPRVPLRLSVERRQRLDRAGRSAWSAYAAGGFYRRLPGDGIVDGYAQAGVVGARSRDLFVDGAIRAGRRIAGGPAEPMLGVGLWGAAQPGVARLDAGPRASLRIAPHLVAEVEGRFRIAGRARPGSGVALTLAAAL